MIYNRRKDIREADMLMNEALEKLNKALALLERHDHDVVYVVENAADEMDCACTAMLTDPDVADGAR